ncbi:MAG TPA: M20/M25/M40 family metallo-hydrolase [Nitrospira sp.]|nr:M20/M25/M40 family metallo-hydrolase [Nitrospira sp.]
MRSAVQSISNGRMVADVETLSGGGFNGRQSGSSDDWKSAEFVAHRFASLGLTVAPLDVPEAGTPDENGAFMSAPVFSIGHPQVEITTADFALLATPPADYLPVLDSPSVNVTAPVVYVGYGIADPDRGYDDYAGQEVRNKIVLFMRGKPDHLPTPVSHAEKVRTARERGAVAYLTVTAPILSPYEARRGMTTDPSAFYGRQGSEPLLPGAWISTALADKILSSPGAVSTLRSLQEAINASRRPRSKTTQSSVHMVWEGKEGSGALYNVIASLPGRDPEVRHERIVLGAHRDHFGRQADLLFPGADDNASGTAVMLEVARVMRETALRPRRAIDFISFSGEEQGMVGSRFYVSRALQRAGKVNAMINVDHAGIGNGRLTVGLAGVDKSRAIEAAQRSGLFDRVDLFGFFPGGDHVPFKEAGVPTVTIVSGGPHPHFHKPSDTADTINPEILEAVARYVCTLLWQLANAPAP